MLKYRLLIGTLMTVCFGGLMLLDGWLDGSIFFRPAGHVQGSILCILLIWLMFLAQLELSRLANNAGHRIFLLISIPASIVMVTCWYWPQLAPYNKMMYVLYTLGLYVAAVFLFQGNFLGTANVIGNCGANFFAILYLGLLGAFALGIRVDFGVWPLLMFVAVVKVSDIGAYTLGSMMGKHKFSPTISPGKTWEGMLGAIIFAVIVGIIFAYFAGIMTVWAGALFGFIFAFVSQLGDLAESMIKRDARQKDSSQSVPGFGGVLDVIDSPLMAAPFAYVFFMIVRGGL